MRSGSGGATAFFIRSWSIRPIPIVLRCWSARVLESAWTRSRKRSLRQAGLSAILRRDAYTVFPETASAAVEMTIALDGSPARVLWGSKLSDVAGGSRRPKLFRFYEGDWRRVRFDADDRRTFSVPLLPGDRVER